MRSCILRSKSKDRGESEYNKAPSRNEAIYKSFTTMKRETEGNNNDDSISISSSRSSLASWDLALRQSFHKHVSICKSVVCCIVVKLKGGICAGPIDSQRYVLVLFVWKVCSR